MRVHALMLIVVAASAITISDYVLHERRFTEHGLTRNRRVDASSVLTFRIALKQSNLEHGYNHLMEVSHPSSSKYGKHWTVDQVRDTFRPSHSTITKVREWLLSHAIDGGTLKRGYLSFDIPVAKAESMFQAEYYEHEGSETGDIRVGCDEYYLPAHIAPHVDFIVPGVAFSLPLEKRTALLRERPVIDDEFGTGGDAASAVQAAPSQSNGLPPNLQRCGHRISPECIKALYKLPSWEEVASAYKATPANSLGVFELDGTYNQDDMNLFFQKFAPNIPNNTHTIPAPINGAKIKQHYFKPYTNFETELDLQVAYPIIYPQTITQYQVSPKSQYLDQGDNFPLNLQDFLDAIDGTFCDIEPPNEGNDCGIYIPRNVISISYGASELAHPEKYITRLCNEFMKLSLQGTTFAVSSGDFGVAVQPGFREPGNQVSNGCVVVGSYNKTFAGDKLHDPKGVNGTVFQGQFPATCPYVLSVGGTRLYPDQTVKDAESVMQVSNKFYESFSSSGGFSNYFKQPSYQHKAVSSYFANHNPPYPYYNFNGVDFHDPDNNIGANGGLYNRAGRGFPDVSSNGANIYNVNSGKTTTALGTSAAAPTWASIFTLINEKRTAVGKGPVGFVNPVLYEHPEVFNDIVNGTNPGCFTPGFAAVPGWDPATGLGAPNYPKLLELFMSLP